ncbi:MAG: hydrogenase maturation nickel metallochaperone HypA [Oscillospiraceae bacterium]|nr:hydrogenase maturation nickel metallochaperone HypA [Oscillospiraceae bacterium]
MHELSIARSLLELVERTAEQEGFKRVLEIRIRMGEYSGIIPDCLREFFPIAAKGSRAEGAELVLDTVPAAFRCLDCGYEGPVERKTACCPRCESAALRMTHGREFYVENLKVE